MAHTAHREAGLEHPPFPPTKVGRVAHLLGAETLHLEYPTQVVFDSVTLGIDDGDRIGIVGRNGDGKSSLLGLLAGRILPDSGRVTRRGGVRVGVLDQADTLDGTRTVGRELVGDKAEHEWAGDPGMRDVIDGLVADIAWDARSRRCRAASDAGCSWPRC